MASPKKVMIVDDDPVSLSVAKAVLEDLGYNVTTRDRALGTSLAIVREQPDIVLVDIAMPGVSGDAIVRLGRSNPALKNVVFVLYSGDRASELDRLVEETGAAGAIAKVGDIQVFAQKFQQIVAASERKP
ncbi:MAG: response regulator [Vicinamibacteria bacterium]|nr:response regulator [Vicinamibacteria bacterium]